MTTQSVTLSASLDMAVEKMAPLRRRVMKIRLKNDKYRNRVLGELKLRLSEDDACCALLGEGMAAGLADETFGDNTPFSIDLDNLDQFLQLILKYLPQILDIVFKLFAVLSFVALSLSVTGAQAQTVCANGQCFRQAVQTVASAPATVVRSVVEQRSNYSAVSGSSGYGSSGAAAASSGYGSGGSAAATRVPLLERVRQRFQSRASSRYSAVSAAAGYGSSGAAVQGFGSNGSAVTVLVPMETQAAAPVVAPACQCGPDCSCGPDCQCRPADVASVAPQIGLPSAELIETYLASLARQPGRDDAIDVSSGRGVGIDFAMNGLPEYR